MFIKPFRAKSNVQLKSSDRKKLQSKISACFTVTEDDLNVLVPSKASVSLLKIITHSAEIVTVYTVDKRPVFFETPENRLLPTVYAMWLLPELVPLFTTHPDVLPRLVKGANLMLPGVIRQGQGARAYGNYRKDDVVAVNLTSNRAAVGVGLLTRSSDDLYMCGGVGVCVTMIHVFGDKLWSIEMSMCLQVPSLGSDFEMPNVGDFPALAQTNKSAATAPKPQPSVTVPKFQAPTEHFPALGLDPRRKPVKIVDSAIAETAPVVVTIEDVPIEALTLSAIVASDQEESSDDDEQQPSATGPVESIASEDDILKMAFLTALKRDGKQLVLPLLTSTFYRCNVVPAAERPIELKKTTHKKLSKFLSVMAEDRFITVKEELKGIEKIVAINFEHPDLVEFVPKVQAKDGNVDAQNGTNLFVTEMTELYLVTDETAKFFARFNIGNGDGVEKAQLKRILKEYVCNNKLQDPTNAHIIRCNDILASLCGGTGCERIEFDRLFSLILSKMTHSFEMRSKSELKSSKNPMIQMQLATRSGNKKVTLVNNLEAFGIRLAEFEKACKIGVAASTTVTKLANQKGEQLLVQGNQVRFIHKLLTETYKIPAKNIIGIDLAKKEKKSKKK